MNSKKRPKARLDLAPLDQTTTTKLGEEYMKRRQELLKDNGNAIIEFEKKYKELFTRLILENAEQLRRDFDLSSQLRPFWANSQPQQRGRKPKGDSVPYTEVGEASLTGNITSLITHRKDFGNVRFPGLPAGGDMRFANDEAFVHFDIKVTGPRDELDKVVLPPHQFSGDGATWGSEGVENSIVTVFGYRGRKSLFRPGLPPFYVVGGKTLICVTYILKTVYTVDAAAKAQPLHYFELISVPNGLLLFAGPNYQEQWHGLLSAGKDDKSVPAERARRRVYLDVLSELAAWRCTMFRPKEDAPGEWYTITRADFLKQEQLSLPSSSV